MSDSDCIFLDEGGILVTKTRFVSGAQTFALANISSVRGVEAGPNRIGFVFLILIGVFISLGGTSCVSDAPWPGRVLIVIGIAIVCMAIVAMCRQRPLFVVMVISSGGEMEAYSSHDKDFMARVINALNQAIISRG
jgi:hypothetical protein